MKVQPSSRREKREDGSRRWAAIDLDHPDDHLHVTINGYAYGISIDQHGGLHVSLNGGAVVVGG